MDNEKPQTIGQYKTWLKKEHEIKILDRAKTHYESVTATVRGDFKDSDFWTELIQNLVEFDGEYSVKSGYPLLIPPFERELLVKPFDSFLLKTFRKNILENTCWPEPPEGGWILPDNWYTRINDMIRTFFVVKYLDGVEFIIDKIKSLCQHHDMECTVVFEAREEGYYAGHLYTKQQFEVPRMTWDTERLDVMVEIQITTQLQEVIRRLLHQYYEQRRQRIREEDIKWQWNYQSDEFAANYLGHILHYVEGMIMEVREKQEQEVIR